MKQGCENTAHEIQYESPIMNVILIEIESVILQSSVPSMDREDWEQ